MEAKESKIIDILTENKKYIIPPYQRPYSWNKEHTEDLLEDIYSSFVSDNKEYFIGTLICIDSNDNYVYEVVDGQQRLTTLSLIFAKMKDMISTKQNAKENLIKRVLQVDDFSDEAQESRIKVRKSEYELYYHYILQGNKKYCPESPNYTEQLYIDNFNFIQKYLEDKIGDNENLLCSLAKYILEQVYVVFVKTDNLVSSFRLFNVLNTRGLPLSSSDLIKNSLFEAAESRHISYKTIEDYWLKIEDTTGVKNIDKFLRMNQVSQKKDRDRASRELFTEYSEIISNDKYDNPREFVLDLLNSAKNYERIKNPEDFQDISIRKVLSSLNRLTDEWVPAVLAFLNRMNEDATLNNIKSFQKFITMFEKCYMQSWFQQQVKSKREAVIYSALVSINSGESLESIIDSLKKHYNNPAFIESLSKDIYEPYSGKVNFIKAVLLRIDQEIQDDTVYKQYGERISIEHILSQRISDQYWHKRFTESEHNYWIHKLGNLTLLSGIKNSQASNSSFEEKKNIYNNPRKSLDITREVCDYAEWNPESIQTRHKNLIEKAISIWLVK